MIAAAGTARLALACSLFAAAQAPAAPTPGAAYQARLETFDAVWTAVRDRYYDPAFNGLDWGAVRARYRTRVASVTSDAELHSLLRAMLGELRDGHTRILTPQQARDRRAHQTTATGALLFEVEGRPVVFDVLAGSPAAEAGLKPGLRVLAVNGLDVEEALRRASAEVGPSSSQRAALVLSYLRLISGPPHAMLRLRLADAKDAAFDVALPRRALPTAPRFESRLLPSRDLYVRFDRFRKPVARQFRAALVRWPDARGLIIDLRSNTGGDGKEGVRLAAPLLGAPTLVARLATRSGKPPSALGGLVKLPLQLKAGRAGGQLFSRPVVILTNAATASTSEVISTSLQEQGRARVVGTRTCGCALGVLRYRRLPGGAALAISEVGLLSGRGRRIEGEGVAPDVAVDVTIADLREGKDPALAAAIKDIDATVGRSR